MIGGINGNPVFPVNLEENQFQCNSNPLTQLQLFGNFPAGIDVNPGNYAGNDHIPALSRPSKRSREVEDRSKQQNLQISFHNYCQERADQLTTFLNPNDVSTGLRLSYDDDEHNSSVTSASGSMPSLNIMMSLSDNVKNEIDRQKEELENYIRIQEQHIARGVRELKERHTASFLSAIEKDIGRQLREKDLQIENIKKKNKELVEKIKQVAKEAESWHCRARYNESVVHVLKNNLKQAIAQGGDAKEGCGDSEVDDAASSSYNHPNILLGSSIPQTSSTGIKRLGAQMACKSCKIKEISMLLLPCRHLCLCKDCEAFIHLCPVCHCMKTTSVQVYMS
ncbi:hypothetical protein Taro_038336 [Colocasia esculenta]|uniref:RING-type domain-containing protein n=1 Tax=Colocasia esculenta TaxID=4460 RepID=A0A843WLY2_COLES|nr:hypothetical protein [Colocasia esculenta]